MRNALETNHWKSLSRPSESERKPCCGTRIASCHEWRLARMGRTVEMEVLAIQGRFFVFSKRPLLNRAARVWWSMPIQRVSLELNSRCHRLNEVEGGVLQPLPPQQVGGQKEFLSLMNSGILQVLQEEHVLWSCSLFKNVLSKPESTSRTSVAAPAPPHVQVHAKTWWPTIRTPFERRIIFLWYSFRFYVSQTRSTMCHLRHDDWDTDMLVARHRHDHNMWI